MNNPIIRFKKVDGSDFSDWKESSFQEIFEFRSSISLSRSQLNYTNGEVKNIHYGDILLKFPSIIHTDNKLIPYINQDCIPNKYDRLEKGDVVFADTAEDYSLGKAIEIGSTPFRITSGLHTIACKTKLKFASGFLVYYLNSNFYHRQINKLATGTKVYSIIKSNIIKTKLRTPSSLEEQQKIASFFSTLDQKIELNERKVEALEKLKKGIVQKIFTQEIRFKDKNGNQFPNWCSKKLLYVAPLQRGFDLPNSNLVPGSFPVVYSNGINFSHNSYKCEGEAVITGRSGTIGRVTYLPNCRYWPHNTTLWVTNFFNNIPKFIYYLYQYIDLHRFSTGTGVPTLNRNIIHDFVVTIPIRDEQLKISQFLTTIDTKINTAKLRLERLQELKKGFMQQMFV